jgi:outer membrane protein assembly factor BamC
MRSFYSTLTVILVLAAVTTLSGCSWMGRHFVDRSKEYVHAEGRAPLRLPRGVGEEAIEPLLVVPRIPPQPQPEMFADAAPRPTTLFGPEQEVIKIQMLGAERWLVIPQPPALVWAQVKQFFIDNGVAIAHEAAGEGRIDTAWLELQPGLDRDVVRRALAEAKAEAGLSGGRDRLLVQLEQGLRASSSEVVIKHEHDPGDGSRMAIGRDLRGHEGATEVDRTLLNDLGSYLAANVDEPAFSLQAAALASRGKAVVTQDDDGIPVLRLELDFDRAWATLRQALTDANVGIQDLDRSEGVFYLEVREQDLTGEADRRFMSRWRRQPPPLEVKLRMQPTERGFQVVLFDEQNRPLDRDMSHTFLVKLREFAT